MEPLILSFRETSNEDALDYTLVSYSDELNLSVVNENGKPAVSVLNLGTSTFTKTQGETSDADRSSTQASITSLVGTSTGTRSTGEQSDADHSKANKLKALLATTTITESKEATDKD